MTKVNFHIITLFSLLLLQSCQDTTAPTPPDPIARAQIKLKSDHNYQAGHPIWMMIQTKNKKVKPVELIISNGLYTVTSIRKTNKKIKLDSALFKTSGTYDLLVLEKGKILYKRQIFIKSDDIIEPLDIYTGPSSIIVGGQQKSMITVIPTDKHDNAIYSENLVKIKSKRGKRINKQTSIKHLIGQQEITSKEKSGKIILGVKIDKNTSREQEIQETPDWANSFTLNLIKHYPYADNRQYLKLRTSRITDKYGNQIADGTLVHFHTYEKNLIAASYKAIVIDGIANVFIRNPNHACDWTIKASIGPVISSNEIKVKFLSNIDKLVYTYDDFIKQIRVGPLKSALGQLVPDGTTVTLTHNETTYEDETYNGVITFHLVELGILSKEEIVISAGGFNQKIQL